MNIVIHCLGLPFNGDTIKTSSLGGSETAAYYMAKGLAARGHEVTIFTNSDKVGVFDGVKYEFAGEMSENLPLGNRFHYYASNTPHDVLIIQRHPLAFRFQWASKINLWWVHDLASVRSASLVNQMMWNVDGVLTVSEFHKDQYCKVYGLNPDIVYPIQNGIDLSLFEGDIDSVGKKDDAFSTLWTNNKRKLLYTSRPERGLEHLVAPNGIMERLYEKGDNFNLFLCNYANVTNEMKSYYDYLYKRCEDLPNVTVLGHLTKQDLADVMRCCDALVYPTPGPQSPNFEEVSCITMMEAMAAGLPVITTDKGALPETCEGSGCLLVKTEDELPSIESFVEAILTFPYGDEEIKGAQLKKAESYNWDVAVEMTLGHIKTCFEKHRSKGSILKHLMENSDMYAFQKSAASLLDEKASVLLEENIAVSLLKEFKDCYKFIDSDKAWGKHYDEYYQYEKARGVEYGPESLDNNPRFEYVASLVSNLPGGSVILDYGCAHGHYTINLAKRFPDKEFIGVDLVQSNINTARKWAIDEKVENASFCRGNIELETSTLILTDKGNLEGIPLFDCIIAAEVLEHVDKPGFYTDVLSTYARQDSLMILTTPYGPWEYQGYKRHYPWRAHVHHLEKMDLMEIWGHNKEFRVVVVPSGRTKEGEDIGSYVTTYMVDSGSRLAPKKMNYDRKISLTKPRQTLSVCMIVKDSEDTLKRTLDSIRDIADEIIICVDESTTDRTVKVIEDFQKDCWYPNNKIGNRSGISKYPWPIVEWFTIDPVLKIGFDEARNTSISKASGDWVLWIDSDEILIHPENIYKYLRSNQFNGYGIRQHHFSGEPMGILKTDMPCRLFRNREGIKFFGVVHEHPEKELNKGVGHVQIIQDMEIAHYGYTTEDIRRERFNRNIDLLVKDRKKYPDRTLGKFLWIRDLAQMCKYEYENNGGKVTPLMKNRAAEGIALWEELLEEGHIRMLIEGIQFYDLLAKISGDSFEFSFNVNSSKLNGGAKLDSNRVVTSHYVCEEHAVKLMNAVFKEQTKEFSSNYY